MKKITKRNQNQTQTQPSLSALPKRPMDLWNSLWGLNWPGVSEDFDTTGNFVPEVDISETKKAFRLKVNLPDVDPDKVNVEIDGNMLILSGETEKEEREEDENYHRIERVSGSFYRSFELPNTVDFEKISCASKNGVLTVEIPKKAKSVGRKIKVEKK